MGAWGDKAFENDSACDWFGELESEGVSALRAMLTLVAEFDADDYLDVDEGSAAIAAAEIVAAALGKGRDRLSDDALAWLDANPAAITPADRALAQRAVARVDGDESELRALWDENGADTAWHLGIRELQARLAP